MVCNVCGRESVNSDANFCYYCGAALNENGPEVIYIKKPEEAGAARKENPSMGLFSVFFEESKDGREYPVTFKQWLFLLLAVMIPAVGVFIYFILLFVLAFNSRAKQTLKNWARAMLITLVVTFGMIAFAMPELMPMMGGL